jgi:SAM-dependent methyltransferase
LDCLDVATSGVGAAVYALAVPDVRERWRSGWLDATVYDSAVEREHVARVLGRLIWGMDASRFYRDIARLGEEPDDAEILDVPCGGGVAFRGLRAGQRVRYVAADLSPVMLERARAEAQRRGLGQIEFIEADVNALPFETGSFHLCVSYTGLHCFRDPPAALAEMVRVLRPGGVLRGTTIVKNAGLRQDAFVRLMQVRGSFGPACTRAELELWLADAGLVGVNVGGDGALAYFSARRRRRRRSKAV